jgi:dolichyl-phosphate-mannose-protein mannosyltransferase
VRVLEVSINRNFTGTQNLLEFRSVVLHTKSCDFLPMKFGPTNIIGLARFFVFVGLKAKQSQHRKKAAPPSHPSGLPIYSRKKDQKTGLLRVVERHPYVWLFLFICLIYVGTLTDTAFDWISDGQVMFDTAVSLHEFGELGISPNVVDPNTGVNGTTDYFGKYGLGTSLVGQLPLLIVPLVEKTFGEGRSNVLFAMMSMLITALTALLVALCMREFGYRFRSCALAAGGFALGTPAWPYTSYDFSEPLQALCLAAGFWFLLCATRNQPPLRMWLILSGFTLGYAVFTKALLLTLIPS